MMSDENLQKYESLIELTSVLGQQNEFDEIIRIVTAQALSLFNADAASIIMINPRTDNTIKTIIRNGKEFEGHGHHFLQTNVVGWVSKNNQSFITNDLKGDSRFSRNLFKETAVKSVMCVPLYSEGIAIGYLLVISKAESINYNQEKLSYLEKFGAVVAPYLSNLQKIAEYFEISFPESVLFAKYEPLGLIGRSKKFKELLKAIEAAAKCDVRVLLEGESGTGKELIAKAIHKLSPRCENPFIALDCGAIPEHLIESELFGHVRGAFTGAVSERRGLFEEANKGTLFLDEISNLPLEMQAKMLRVLQENEIRVVGSNQIVKVNVRIIAASSPPLRDLVDRKRFREDLYYRLHVYPIHVPTLIERKEDIPLLADHFLKKFSLEQSKKIDSFSFSMIKFLQNRRWEGNIRELENFVERLVTLTPDKKKTIDTKIIPKEYLNEFKGINKEETIKPSLKSLRKSIDEFERALIEKTLRECNWNQTKTARILKISERAIRYRMEKLGIKKPF